jgi:hypothetical protein
LVPVGSFCAWKALNEYKKYIKLYALFSRPVPKAPQPINRSNNK